ncbi:MAG: type II toxin-antitoxin system VapC family toxin [Candidatus Methylomirabilia bacterium]
MGPRAIFVDTGAWYALQVSDDQFHGAASAVFPKVLAQFDTFVTSNHVVSEAYTLLRGSRGFRDAWQFLEALERSPRVELYVASAGLEREACGVLREFPELPLSFVGGVSLCMMRQRGIPHAFAFDPYFARAGFVRIPTDLAL